VSGGGREPDDAGPILGIVLTVVALLILAMA
jgi:hypothetical protein